jgi:photosystem II stability/assembly factor-like uncharacterized protein
VRRAACLVFVCALALAGPVSAEISPELAQAIATTKAKFPKLMHFTDQDHFLGGVDDAELELLKKRVGSGPFDDSVQAAVLALLEGFSREQGPANTFGRNLTSEIAGLAATSGDPATLEGVGKVLEGFLMDQSHPYSILAQGLLAEKIRCGAASQGMDDFVARITDEVNPDKEFGFGTTDGTTADRFGIHPNSDLFTVAASGARVVAAGYFGSLLVSSNAGDTWDSPATGTDEPLYAVAFGPGDEVWAAGRAGVVLRSGDSGRSWMRRPTPFARHVFGLFASDKDTVLAVGDFGLQLRTVDGGNRWTCIPRVQDVILGRLTRAGPTDAIGVGEFGTIERLAKGVPPAVRGKLSGVPEDTYVYDAWMDAEGKVGVAVGLTGTILRSTDGGASWAKVQTKFTQDLFGVGGSGTHVVVSGEGGLLAVSNDAGLTFTESTAPSLPVSLLDVEFGDDTHVYAVGPRGLILRSTDSGSHFTQVHPGAHK